MLYLYGEPTEEEANQLVDLLGEHLAADDPLRVKAASVSLPTLPKTVFVLCDAHEAHQIILLLNRSHADLPVLAILQGACYELYGQELTAVRLYTVSNVAAIERVVREVNLDDETDGLSEPEEL